MEEIDWRDIDERHLEAYRLRVALVETLLDESIDEADRIEVRRRYIEEHEVSERTIRNYLHRYRQEGAEEPFALCASSVKGISYQVEGNFFYPTNRAKNRLLRSKSTIHGKTDPKAYPTKKVLSPCVMCLNAHWTTQTGDYETNASNGRTIQRSKYRALPKKGQAI